MASKPDPDRPGFGDLVTPFIFVKHGDPDPVEWKRANPGWVSFPATFVPHKKPTPKWAIINGRRWPLDKRGQPWPRSRFGQPLCPLDEFPPGVPAPGTQGVLIEREAAALQQTVALVRSGELTPEWFTAERLRGQAERNAREAANPSPPPPPSAHTYDPSAPSRAYLAHRADEADVLQKIGADPDGLGSIRRYQATAQGMDAFGRNYAGGARQRTAMRAEAARPAPTTEAADSLNVAAPAAKPPETITAAQPPARLETARQVAAAFGGGAADAVRNAAQGVRDLAKDAGRFATDGAFRQEVADSAARLAKLSLDMAAYVASDPRGAAQGVADGARSLYDQHQAAREQARQNGTLAEFDARFAGRLAGEGVLAFLPFGTIAKAGKATRFGRGPEHFREAADQSSSPALRGNPYHPEAVEARIGKPEYRTNQAHNTFSPRYNPKKTPEPRDAAEVYSRSVQGKIGTWYGRSLESGEYYQFRFDRVDSAHFTKIVTEDDVPEETRILLNQAKR